MTCFCVFFGSTIRVQQSIPDASIKIVNADTNETATVLAGAFESLSPGRVLTDPPIFFDGGVSNYGSNMGNAYSLGQRTGKVADGQNLRKTESSSVGQ